MQQLRDWYHSARDKTAAFVTAHRAALLWTGIGLGLVCIVALTAVTVVTYSAYDRVTVKSALEPNPTPPATPKPWVDAFNQLEPYSLLLLGYGGGGHDGGRLTDTIMLAHIVPEEKSIFLISIPRDTWVALPTRAGEEMTHWKINAAYPIGLDDRTYPNKPLQYTGEAGGGELAKHAVQTVTNIPVDGFVSIDFAGFISAIDALGGITVQVERSFTDPLYPIEELADDPCGRTDEDIAAITATMSASEIEKERMFPCRYEELEFTAGPVTMDAETALKYARSRHSAQDGGDFNRAARQRQVLLAVKEKVLKLDFVPKILPLISRLSYNVQTDLDTEKMQEFVRYHEDLSTYNIHSIALTDDTVLKQGYSSNGQYVLLPRAGEDSWQETHDWLKEQMSASTQASSAARLEIDTKVE